MDKYFDFAIDVILVTAAIAFIGYVAYTALFI